MLYETLAKRSFVHAQRQERKMMITIESMNSIFVAERKAQPAGREKRAGEDRRGQDFGPPEGYGERRLCPERRLPEVCFGEFDEHIVISAVRRSRR
jgi:hypothetical protein